MSLNSCGRADMHAFVELRVQIGSRCVRKAQLNFVSSCSITTSAPDQPIVASHCRRSWRLSGPFRASALSFYHGGAPCGEETLLCITEARIWWFQATEAKTYLFTPCRLVQTWMSLGLHSHVNAFLSVSALMLCRDAAKE